MKRFEFRLEQVVRLKKQREWLAEIKARQARMTFEATLAEAAALVRQLAEIAEALAARRDQQADPVSWVTRHEQSTRLGELLRAAEVRVEQAGRAYQDAERQRTQIAIEVEGLLTLRRYEWTEHRHEAALHQQGLLDEIGLRRWRSRQNGSASPT